MDIPKNTQLSTSERALAAFLFLQDYRDADENTPLANDVETLYLREAQRLVHFYNLLMNKRYLKDVDESELTLEFYEISKTAFGSDKNDLKRGFKKLYQVLFQTDTGPRLPVFIKIYGFDEFVSLLYNRLDDPFKIRELVGK